MSKRSIEQYRHRIDYLRKLPANDRLFQALSVKGKPLTREVRIKVNEDQLVYLIQELLRDGVDDDAP